MSDTFANFFYLAFTLGITIGLVVYGVAWIVNLARHMFMDD